MGLFLHCIGVLALLYSSQSAAARYNYPNPNYPNPKYPNPNYPNPNYPNPNYPNPNYPNPNYPNPNYPNPNYQQQQSRSTGCVTCAEAECDGPASKISACGEVYKPPEGSYAEELMSYWPKIFGERDLLADSLYRCYALTFTYDHDYMLPNVAIMRNITWNLKLRDCGPVHFCFTLLNYRGDGDEFTNKFGFLRCTELDQIPLPCNNFPGNMGFRGGKTSGSKKKAASSGAVNKSGSRACLMWLSAVVFLFRL